MPDITRQPFNRLLNFPPSAYLHIIPPMSKHYGGEVNDIQRKSKRETMNYNSSSIFMFCLHFNEHKIRAYVHWKRTT